MDSTIDQVEQARLQLEKNVQRLQAALKHWRTEEADYEGLKEGLAELDDDASEERIRSIATDCEGDKVGRSGASNISNG